MLPAEKEKRRNDEDVTRLCFGHKISKSYYFFFKVRVKMTPLLENVFCSVFRQRTFTFSVKRDLDHAPLTTIKLNQLNPTL